MGTAAAPVPFVLAAALCCCSHRTTAVPGLFVSPTTSQLSDLRLRSMSQRGSIPFSSWSGLNRLGVSSWRSHIHKDKKEKRRIKAVYASLFGVGAPEALVIGVVALLVFGPKGLAEVARNLGKTLRAFQPTIRELQEVSREFKTTLEKEIGLDEVTSTNYIDKSALYSDQNQQPAIDPNGKPAADPSTGEELLKVTDVQLAASASKSQEESSSTVEQPQAEPISDIPSSKPSNETGSQAQVQTEVPSSGQTENRGDSENASHD